MYLRFRISYHIVHCNITLSVSNQNDFNLSTLSYGECAKIKDWMCAVRFSLHFEKTLQVLFTNRFHDVEDRLNVAFC